MAVVRGCVGIGGTGAAARVESMAASAIGCTNELEAMKMLGLVRLI